MLLNAPPVLSLLRSANVLPEKVRNRNWFDAIVTDYIYCLYAGMPCGDINRIHIYIYIYICICICIRDTWVPNKAENNRVKFVISYRSSSVDLKNEIERSLLAIVRRSRRWIARNVPLFDFLSRRNRETGSEGEYVSALSKSSAARHANQRCDLIRSRSNSDYGPAGPCCVHAP